MESAIEILKSQIHICWC